MKQRSTLLGPYHATSLTRSQLSIWSGQQLSADRSLYNMILAFEFNGHIDQEIFLKAFQEIVDQHDVLRMVIQTNDNLPSQWFYEKCDSQLEYIDFSSTSNPNIAYASWVETHKGRIFEDGELLYHSALLKLGEEKFVWYLNQHHLITDGFSMIMLYDQQNDYYHELLLKENIAVNEKHTFYDYALDQIDNQTKEVSDYWKTKEGKSQAPLAFYGQKATNIGTGATRITVSIGKERTDRLRNLAQAPKIKGWNIDLSLQHIFMTIMNAFIYRVSGQEEMAVGVVSHNRQNATHKQVAGLFMEIYPLTVTVDSEDSFLDQFKKVRDEFFETMKHVAVNKPSTGQLRGINVLFNFIPMGLSSFGEIPVQSDWILSGHNDPAHHIRLQIQDFDSKGDFKLQFDLKKEMFDDQLCTLVPQHFINLLDAFIANKEASITKVPITTDDEIGRLESWNKTQVAFPADVTLLTAYEDQVKKTPANIALNFGNKSMTYQAFDQQVNQLANHLLEKGIIKQGVVAVSVERSFEMMVSIYAIVKLGAIYLPLDTHLPEARRKYILEDANAKLLLTDSKTLDKVVYIDALDVFEVIPGLKNESTDRPDVLINEEDIAYIIYTSGSTGQPKGVRCHHKGICNRLQWMQQDYPLSEHDVLIQKTPITFDVSIWELFWPLRIGASLVLAQPEEHKDSQLLIKTISNYGVTIIHFVPSMFNAFLNDMRAADCMSLKKVFCSGEALSASAVDKFHTIYEHTKLINLYGPTEASVDVSAWHCSRGEPSAIIPIGRPVANTKLYVLDEHMNRVPIGVIGELYIAGAQVAKGYLNRDKLTEERFVTDIFCHHSQQKMYKTGDLVRFRSDGVLEYHGRTDDQIKLRGFRIELDEIALTMERHPDIDQSVVVLQRHENGLDFLVAYYTGKELEHSDIRNFLLHALPEYMVPSFSWAVPSFELTSSGKVDKKSLPSLSMNARNQEQIVFATPENELEEMVLKVWQEVLKQDKISVKANFVQMGGDSLMALAITSRLREALDMELSPDLVFGKSNIRLYAKHIEQTMIEIMEKEEDGS